MIDPGTARSDDGSPSGTFKYWAFLSYSHCDASLARRLHRDLERYQVPKPLVGRPGHHATIPSRLFPIFRDREELASSPDLSDSIRAAIAQSACLIVVCSPAASRSKWVDAEVLAFRRLRPEGRIYPVIVGGTPNASHPAEECFPPSLRFEESPGKPVSDQFAGPVAADMRSEGDGWEDGKLKLIAGLLGVPLNELRRREVVEARKRARIFQGIAAVLLLLTAASVAGGWMAYQNQKKAERRFDVAIDIASGVVDKAVALSDKYGVPRSAIGELLDYANTAFTRLSIEGLSDSLKLQQANYQLALADHYAFAANSAEQLRLAQQARDLLLPLVGADRENVAARRKLSEVYDRIGKTQTASGHLDEALTAHRKQLAEDEALLALAPADPARRRAIAVSEERIGTVLALQGKLQEALQSQKRAMAISERLANELPLDPEAARDLAVAHEKLGELLQSLDNGGGDALNEHRAAWKIRVRLAEHNPGSNTFQRDLEVSFNKIGQIMLARQDVLGSVESHKAARDIAIRLVDSDPENSDWQADLAGTKLWLGDALLVQRNVEQAMSGSTTARDIFHRVVRKSPWRASYRFGLAGCFERIGDIQLERGQVGDALASYAEKQRIAADLVAADPATSEWQRDLLIAHVKLGEAFQRKQGGQDAARDNYGKALEIARRLQAAGRLSLADAWMVPSLQQRAKR